MDDLKGQRNDLEDKAEGGWTHGQQTDGHGSEPWRGW